MPPVNVAFWSERQRAYGCYTLILRGAYRALMVPAASTEAELRSALVAMARHERAGVSPIGQRT